MSTVKQIGLVGVIWLAAACTTPAVRPGIADNKKLGSILNNDINNILIALSGSKTTPAEYKKAVFHLLDANPGVLAQNVGNRSIATKELYEQKCDTVYQHFYESYMGQGRGVYAVM